MCRNYLIKIIFVGSLMLSAGKLSAQSLCKESTLKSNWNNSDYVLIGKVISVGPSAKTWSGIIWVDQKVNYEVIKNLKGEITKKEIRVSHYVVHNSLTADKEFPQLSLSLFSKVNLLILFLNKKTAGKDNKIEPDYESEDANCGAVAATESFIKLITSNPD